MATFMDSNGNSTMKHDHWSAQGCSRCTKVIGPTVETLHSELVQIASAVGDLLDALEAEAQLKDGFKGMGHNVVQSKASSKNHYIRELKRLIEK